MVKMICILKMSSECFRAFETKRKNDCLSQCSPVSAVNIRVYTMPNNKLDLEKLMKLVNLMENNRKFSEVVRVNNDENDDDDDEDI